MASAAQHLDKTTYNVRIKTGDVFQAGTDADVHLKIFGKKEMTDTIPLRTSNNTANKFERNRIDSFTFEFADLGRVCCVMNSIVLISLERICRLNISLLDIMERIQELDGFSIG